MDTREQFTKFSPLMIAVKKNVKRLRRNAAFSMNEAANLLGISRKQLEDLETNRNYGCHIELEILARAATLYGYDFNSIIGFDPSAEDVSSDYLQRPRRTGPKT